MGDGISGEDDDTGEGGDISVTGLIMEGMFCVSDVGMGVGVNCRTSCVGLAWKGMVGASGDVGGICDSASFSGTVPIPGGMAGDSISGDGGGVEYGDAISGMGLPGDDGGVEYCDAISVMGLPGDDCWPIPG